MFIKQLISKFFKYIRETAYFLCLLVFSASKSSISSEMCFFFTKTSTCLHGILLNALLGNRTFYSTSPDQNQPIKLSKLSKVLYINNYLIFVKKLTNIVLYISDGEWWLWYNQTETIFRFNQNRLSESFLCKVIQCEFFALTLLQNVLRTKKIMK